MKVNLSSPIMVDGELTSELEIKEPTFKHLVEMTKLAREVNPENTKEYIWRPRSEGEQYSVLFASLAGITEVEAGALSIKDVIAIRAVVDPFLASPATA